MNLKSLVANQTSLVVRQRFELGEMFGFETRNKYEIYGADGQVIGFAAEQQKGILGFLLRQFVGHWRTFTIHFFDLQRGISFVANHPFRFLFQRLEIFEANGKRIGALQQRFAILRRKFDVEDQYGRVVMNMEAGIFSWWTFPIFKDNREVASVQKRWSGLLTEMFTDKDNFLVEFRDPSLSPDLKSLILAASVFIDLNYFEAKAERSRDSII